MIDHAFCKQINKLCTKCMVDGQGLNWSAPGVTKTMHELMGRPKLMMGMVFFWTRAIPCVALPRDNLIIKKSLQ